jgi:hypothetical protein
MNDHQGPMAVEDGAKTSGSVGDASRRRIHRQIRASRRRTALVKIEKFTVKNDQGQTGSAA